MPSRWEPSDLPHRLPVWRALSTLFLDTEPQPRDYEWIAAQLANSGYSADQARQILEEEVAPAFATNLLDVAGEWLPWSEKEIREIMARSDGQWPTMSWLKRRMFRRSLRSEWRKSRRY